MTFKEAQFAYTFFDPTSYAIALAFIFIIVGLTHLLDVKVFKDKRGSVLKPLFITMPIFIVGMIFFANIYKSEMNELENKVEEQYIEKLPKEKMKVISYGNVDVTDLEIKNHYFTQEESEILALKVRFNKNGIITEKIIKAQIEVVKGLKQAYLEYQVLEQDLTQSQNKIRFKKGYYNTTLYIPE
jgi:hypothetical protein